MRGASFRDMAGADLTVDNVRSMLGLNETLFVEHKGGGEPSKRLAKAMASFANQLGGWVLVNITDDDDPRPLGPLPGWVAKTSAPVDAVRDRLENLIDPLPPFEARKLCVAGGEDDPDDVLVIRVYESADTPHITSDGAIYVRSVAQDRRADKYEARPIENQQVLRGLVERGAASANRVAELLSPTNRLPLGNGGVGLDAEHFARGSIAVADMPLIAARLAPHTLSGRFSGWARSQQAVEAAQTATAELAGHDQAEILPHGQGVALRGAWGPDKAPRSEHGADLGGPVRMAVDAAGLVCASTGFRPSPEQERTGPLSLQGFANRYVAPVIAAPAAVLAAGSILGRISCHVFFWELRGILRVDAEGEILRPKQRGYHGGGLTLPLEKGELEQLAGEAARTFGREAGAESFEEAPEP